MSAIDSNEKIEDILSLYEKRKQEIYVTVKQLESSTAQAAQVAKAVDEFVSQLINSLNEKASDDTPALELAQELAGGLGTINDFIAQQPSRIERGLLQAQIHIADINEFQESLETLKVKEVSEEEPPLELEILPTEIPADIEESPPEVEESAESDSPPPAKRKFRRTGSRPEKLKTKRTKSKKSKNNKSEVKS